MTLTEVMVGVAIMALVATMMASGFLAASAYIRRGSDVERSGYEAAALAEERKREKPNSEYGGAMNFSVNGSESSVSGTYYDFYDTAGGDGETSVYVEFVPAGT